MKIIDKIIEHIEIIKSVGMWLLFIGFVGYVYITGTWFFDFGWTNCGAICYPIPDRLIRFFSASILIGLIISIFSTVVIIDYNRKIDA